MEGTYQDNFPASVQRFNQDVHFGIKAFAKELNIIGYHLSTMNQIGILYQKKD